MAMAMEWTWHEKTKVWMSTQKVRVNWNAGSLTRIIWIAKWCTKVMMKSLFTRVGLHPQVILRHLWIERLDTFIIYIYNKIIYIIKYMYMLLTLYCWFLEEKGTDFSRVSWFSFPIAMFTGAFLLSYLMDQWKCPGYLNCYLQEAQAIF